MEHGVGILPGGPFPPREGATVSHGLGSRVCSAVRGGIGYRAERVHTTISTRGLPIDRAELRWLLRSACAHCRVRVGRRSHLFSIRFSRPAYRLAHATFGAPLLLS